jgi:ABC-type multidrug transport system permease subunit
MIQNGRKNPVGVDPDEVGMSLKLVSLLALRSLLAMALAFAVVVLVNLGGGELADATGFPNGGEARLAWDLGWVFLAGVLAAWAVVKLAPCAPRAHAAVFFVLMLAVAALAVAQFGGDWPRWFSVGILAVPLQVGLGTGRGLRAR